MRIKQRRFSEEFGQFVQAKRSAAGETQIRFSARLGVSPSYLAQIESGVVPPVARVGRMAEGLGEDPAPWLEAAGYGGVGMVLEEAVRPPEIDRTIPRLGTIREHGILEIEGKEGEPGSVMPERFAVVMGSASPRSAFQTGDVLVFREAGTAPRNARVMVQEAESGIRRFVRLVKVGSAENGELSCLPIDAPGMPTPVKLRARVVAKYIGMTTPDY